MFFKESFLKIINHNIISITDKMRKYVEGICFEKNDNVKKMMKKTKNYSYDKVFLKIKNQQINKKK